MSDYHLVIGGELIDVNSPNPEFKTIPEVVGLYPTWAEAYDVWKASAWSTVDNAHMRYLIMPLGDMISGVASKLLGTKADPLLGVWQTMLEEGVEKAQVKAHALGHVEALKAVLQDPDVHATSATEICAAIVMTELYIKSALD